MRTVSTSFMKHPVYLACKQVLPEFQRAGLPVDLEKIDHEDEPSLVIRENVIVFREQKREKEMILDPEWGKAAVERKVPNVKWDGEHKRYTITFNWTEMTARLPNDPFRTIVRPASYRYKPVKGVPVKVAAERRWYKWRRGQNGVAVRLCDANALPLATEEHPVSPEIYSPPAEGVPEVIKAEFYPVMTNEDDDDDEAIPVGFYQGKLLIYEGEEFDPKNYGIPVPVQLMSEMRTRIICIPYQEDAQAAGTGTGQALQSVVKLELAEDEIQYGMEKYNIWVLLSGHGVKKGMTRKQVKTQQRKFAGNFHTDKSLLKNFEQRKIEPPAYLKKQAEKKEEFFKRDQLAFVKAFELLDKQKDAKRQEAEADERDTEAATPQAQPAAEDKPAQATTEA